MTDPFLTSAVATDFNPVPTDAILAAMPITTSRISNRNVSQMADNEPKNDIKNFLIMIGYKIRVNDLESFFKIIGCDHAGGRTF